MAVMHLTDTMIDQVFGEALRVLRVGGQLILLDPVINRERWVGAYYGDWTGGLIHVPLKNCAESWKADSKSSIGKSTPFTTNTFLESASGLNLEQYLCVLLQDL